MGDTEPGVKAGRESDRQEDVIFKQFYNSWRTQTVVALQKSAPNHTDRKPRAQGPYPELRLEVGLEPRSLVLWLSAQS